MKFRRIEWAITIILIIFTAIYCYAGFRAKRYQRYYVEIVHSLESGKGMSTPDFTITRVNGYKIMAIRLNKNMPSSLDVKESVKIIKEGK